MRKKFQKKGKSNVMPEGEQTWVKRGVIARRKNPNAKEV